MLGRYLGEINAERTRRAHADPASQTRFRQRFRPFLGACRLRRAPFFDRKGNAIHFLGVSNLDRIENFANESFDSRVSRRVPVAPAHELASVAEGEFPSQHFEYCNDTILSY